MGKTRKAYPAKFREQMVRLVRGYATRGHISTSQGVGGGSGGGVTPILRVEM
jgi:hypothetical protein